MEQIWAASIPIYPLSSTTTLETKFLQALWQPSLWPLSPKTLFSLVEILNMLQMIFSHSRAYRLCYMGPKLSLAWTPDPSTVTRIWSLLWLILTTRLTKKCLRLCKLSRTLHGGRTWWCLGKPLLDWFLAIWLLTYSSYSFSWTPDPSPSPPHMMGHQAPQPPPSFHPTIQHPDMASSHAMHPVFNAYQAVQVSMLWERVVQKLFFNTLISVYNIAGLFVLFVNVILLNLCYMIYHKILPSGDPSRGHRLIKSTRHDLFPKYNQ